MNQLAEVDPVEDTAHTQYNVKQGIKLFGQRGWTPSLRKCNNCMTKTYCLEPIDPSKLTKEDKKSALSYLMFLKEKCCGKIKGHGCANSHKQ